MIIGKDFGALRHMLRLNLDMYSLIVAWGLDIGEPVELVCKVMLKIVHKDFLVDMDSIFKWVIPRVGLDIFEGIIDA